MWNANPTCRELFRHALCLAFALALLRAGRSIAARIAMIAMTTSSSIKVNARCLTKEGVVILGMVAVQCPRNGAGAKLHAMASGYAHVIGFTAMKPGMRGVCKRAGVLRLLEPRSDAHPMPYSAITR